MNLDAYLTPLLNFLIPIGVVLFLVWVLTKPFKEPITRFWEWITRKFQGENKSKDANQKGIIYE